MKLRAGSPTDFPVEVENLGTFIFAKRTMADKMRVHVEYSRMIEGVFPTAWLDSTATALATFRVLMVGAPAGFDTEFDPLDPQTDDNIMRILAALMAKEDSFRERPQAAVQGSGPTAG